MSSLLVWKREKPLWVPLRNLAAYPKRLVPPPLQSVIAVARNMNNKTSKLVAP